MIKQTAKKTSPWIWYALAIASVLLAAPNGTILKTVTGVMDPPWVNVVRFAIVALVMLPFVIKAIPRMTRKNVGYAVASGFFYSIAVTTYVAAISMSQASYVAVIDLGIPIMLMVYSVYLTRERVSRKALVGISIAALGAFTIIGFPLLVGQGFASNFSMLATVLALMNAASFPLTVILSRKANEHGLNLGATFGVSSIVILTMCVLVAITTAGDKFAVSVFIEHPLALLAIAYSALAVSLGARLLTVASYKHLGSATTGGLYYMESFLAILIPIFLLGEHMTSEMLVGGLLILLGVIVAEARHHPVVRNDHHQAGHRHV